MYPHVSRKHKFRVNINIRSFLIKSLSVKMLYIIDLMKSLCHCFILKAAELAIFHHGSAMYLPNEKQTKVLLKQWNDNILAKPSISSLSQDLEREQELTGLFSNHTV